MKILIRLPNWLGDAVMSTAFIAGVKQLYPGCIIDVIIKKEISGITQLIPGINNVYPFSKKGFKGLPGAYRFGKGLRKGDYAIFFTLPSSVSSAVMGWATGAKQRTGYTEAGGFFLLTKKCSRPLNVHRVDEYISILEQFTGKTIAHKQVKLNVPFAVQNNRVLVNFNSEAESRRMPLDKGRRLVKLLTDTFGSTIFTFIGSAKDHEYVSALLAGAENGSRLENYAGKTDLAGLSAIMAGCKALLTTDSGPAHLANAAGVPAIVLFGAGNERNTAPYNQQSLNILRYGKLECEPCLRNTCQLYNLPKCMEMLDSTKIINALNIYLNHA